MWWYGIARYGTRSLVRVILMSRSNEWIGDLGTHRIFTYYYDDERRSFISFSATRDLSCLSSEDLSTRSLIKAMVNKHCMYSGCICCYDACDFEHITCCCMTSQECLCIVSQGCLAVNAEPLGVGMVTDQSNKECCKIGLYCCALGLKTPTVLCSGASQVLCFQEVASLPFDHDYVDQPVCGYCCVQCMPDCGIAKSPPHCPALQKMRR